MTSIFNGRIRNSAGGVQLTLVVDQQAGASSYSTGGNDFLIPDVPNIKAVIAAQITGGFVAIVDSISTAGVKVKVFESGVADAALGELNAATNLSGETLTLTVIGG